MFDFNDIQYQVHCLIQAAFLVYNQVIEIAELLKFMPGGFTTDFQAFRGSVFLD